MEKTFQFQDCLFKLPIPNLDKTLERFLEWVQPLLDQEQFLQSKKIVEEFKTKDGAILQKILIEKSIDGQFANWTKPLWENVYLKSRVPLIVEGNVFYVLDNKVGQSYMQSEIATRVIISALLFKALIDEERLEVDKSKGDPLCMEQYKNFFSSTRIPRRKKDELRLSSSSQHIMVLFRGNIYILNVYQPTGDIVPYSKIKSSLDFIMDQSATGQGIGVLTTTERHKWAEVRNELLNLDIENKDNFAKIESAIFAVCLDQDGPENITVLSRHMLFGEGTNRWFDKSIQFIITDNSTVGINMEHTGMDGSTMSNLIKYIYDNIDRFVAEVDIKTDCYKIENINFKLNDSIKNFLDQAKEEFNVHLWNNATRVLVFEDFGIDDIKNFGISPDAFIQIALHWAQYRLFGRMRSQYEAVSMRKYLLGRIEVMYSVTNESLDFIKSMDADLYDRNTRKKLLSKAAHKHIERIKECQAGKGVDGHLMGILEMYHRFGKEKGIEELPEFFKDHAYRILTHSTICTSTTSSYGLKLAGWGPVVEDGFAIRYIRYRNSITFNMASRKYLEAELVKLEDYIKVSLQEMADLMRE